MIQFHTICICWFPALWLQIFKGPGETDMKLMVSALTFFMKWSYHRTFLFHRGSQGKLPFQVEAMSFVTSPLGMLRILVYIF